MYLQELIGEVFLELGELLQALTGEQYRQSSIHLSGATIGQHTRHSIELFQCLLLGYDTGVVNYEKRKRDIRIETDKEYAIQLLETIAKDLKRPDRMLTVEAGFGNKDLPVRAYSNYTRELIYNLEHTIHHMALIRVGVQELTDIRLPETFGVAPSTILYRKQCAQ